MSCHVTSRVNFTLQLHLLRYVVFLLAVVVMGLSSIHTATVVCYQQHMHCLGRIVRSEVSAISVLSEGCAYLSDQPSQELISGGESTKKAGQQGSIGSIFSGFTNRNTNTSICPGLWGFNNPLTRFKDWNSHHACPAEVSSYSPKTICTAN